MATFTGTAASESITPTSVSSTVFRDPAGWFPGEGADLLRGNGGDDILDGGTGADIMYGGADSDTYYVDNLGDYLEEVDAFGTDTVFSSVNFTLSNYFENLTLNGWLSVNGIGNELDNIITGYRNANYLNGEDGDDILYGLGGDDTLDGGFYMYDYMDGYVNWDDTLFGGDGNDVLYGSADLLVGGGGNDTYRIEWGSDIVEETNGGIDTVYAYGYFTLPENIEKLYIDGAGYGDGSPGSGPEGYAIGNAQANYIEGTQGVVHIEALGGDDTIKGYGREGELIYGGDGNDYIYEYGEVYTGYGNNIYGGNGSDYIYLEKNYNIAWGDDGDDTIISNGYNEMHGGLGHNTLTCESSGAIFYSEGGSDTMYGGGEYNEFYVDGDDTVFGSAGVDYFYIDNNNVLRGGGGNDDYIFGDYAISSIIEEINGGIDTVYIYGAIYYLPEEVENLFVEGGIGYGNSKDNIISGGGGIFYGMLGNDTLHGYDGHQVLDGGSGADSMQGGAGSDDYYVDNAADIVEETTDVGTDIVYASISYTLTPNVENLTLTGSAVTGTGNSSNNLILGNALANTLSGLLGNDTLTGGGGNDMLYGGTGTDQLKGEAGNDTYYVGDLSDTVTETAGNGMDNVVSNVSHTLSINVENLTLTGTAAEGTGNDSNNVIVGNGSANTLRGLGGNDTLNGGGGDDILYGGPGAGIDRMSGDGGNDTYYIDDSTDLVIETLSGTAGGTDIVYARASFTLGANVESLRMIPGSGALNGTGNASANELWGTSSVNSLRGLAGADTFDSGSGADILIGGAGADIFKYSATAGSNPAARDSIRSGDGAVAFEGAGAGAGDRFDLRTLDANTSLAGVQHFTFGSSTGVARLWAVNSGTDTLIRGNVDGDAAVEFEVAIQDGSVAASAYAAADFLLA